MLVAFAWTIGGFVLGAMRAAPYDYLERGLPGVFVATVQKYLAPGIENGLALGLVFAVLAAVARRMGGRYVRRMAFAIAVTLVLIVSYALVASAPIEGGRLMGVINLVRTVKSPVDLLDAGVRLGMEVEPLAFRAVRIGLAGALALAILLVLHVMRKPAARPIAPIRPARAWVAPVLLVAIVMTGGLLGRQASDPLPVGAGDIVLISIDTLRADHLPVYGYERDTAPNLTALAADGVVVEQFISHAPWTLPSHASMFTGLLPHEHGATDWKHRIRDSVPMFTESLRQRSYRTGAFVSGVYVSDKFGFDRGFDVFRFDETARAVRSVRDAAKWLFSRRRPSFLFLHLFDTHHPYVPPPETYGRFGPATPKIVKAELSFAEFLDWARVDPEYSRRAAADRYDELILHVDQVLGRFFARMKELGRYDSALIVVLSDHGEEFFDHGYWGHSNYLYEEMIRVPLIVKWPFSACAGSRLADAPIPARAIAKLILDVAADPARREELLRCERDGAPKLLHDLVETGPILSETQSMGPNRFSARTTDEKLIEPFAPENLLGAGALARPWEYFRLKEDPREIFNLYEPEIAPALQEAIEAAKRERESAEGGREHIELDRRTVERLKSLGYLN